MKLSKEKAILSSILTGNREAARLIKTFQGYTYKYIGLLGHFYNYSSIIIN
ncbi:hypothetical protein CLV57_2792 [Mucilaginibacter auburnensis]|uniref:Uncharacterized protein n=1 Tax=Mucilaginibacter auburnensis TaxID=1457233 RepID=A0A2H9VMU6_9SPHI|nr:hypothetical protein CLV57_2792 [Mucilaginibacter auburnensis]